MRISILFKWLLGFACTLNSLNIFAYRIHTEAEPHQHAEQIFHAFQAEFQAGDSKEGSVLNFELSGWWGSDFNKFWFNTEVERLNNKTERAEIWGLYSRNISTFWDAQLGARYDTQPTSLGYIVAGFNGLAPYFIETEVHTFLSEEGDLSLRLHAERDFLFTQRLILEPFVEANAYLQSVDALEVGRGLAEVEFGLQLRYEFHRKFSSFLEARYESKIGKTASIAKAHNEPHDIASLNIGVRLLL